jgi:hypothetical protein
MDMPTASATPNALQKKGLVARKRSHSQLQSMKRAGSPTLMTKQTHATVEGSPISRTGDNAIVEEPEPLGWPHASRRWGGPQEWGARRMCVVERARRELWRSVYAAWVHAHSHSAPSAACRSISQPTYPADQRATQESGSPLGAMNFASLWGGAASRPAAAQGEGASLLADWNNYSVAPDVEGGAGPSTSDALFQGVDSARLAGTNLLSASLNAIRGGGAAPAGTATVVTPPVASESGRSWLPTSESFRYRCAWSCMARASHGVPDQHGTPPG